MNALSFRVSWVLIGAALLVAGLGYVELRAIGFPDGHRSDIDLTRATLLRALIGVSLVTCALTPIVDRRSTLGSAGSCRRLLVLAYAATVLVVFMGDVYLRGLSGRGG